MPWAFRSPQWKRGSIQVRSSGPMATSRLNVHSHVHTVGAARRSYGMNRLPTACCNGRSLSYDCGETASSPLCRRSPGLPRRREARGSEPSIAHPLAKHREPVGHDVNVLEPLGWCDQLLESFPLPARAQPGTDAIEPVHHPVEMLIRAALGH